MSVAPHFERGADGVHIVARTPRRRKGRIHDLTIWWREIDRVILILVLTLMGIGIVGVAAGSAASAHRLSTAAKTLDELMAQGEEGVEISIPISEYDLERNEMEAPSTRATTWARVLPGRRRPVDGAIWCRNPDGYEIQKYRIWCIVPTS